MPRAAKSSSRPPRDDHVTGAAASSQAVESVARFDPHIRLALATWPQIDPTVEGIVMRIERAGRELNEEMQAGLAYVGLTKEEFKVLMALLEGPCNHGTLCKELDVSTGAMTNRLDKLEREQLVQRAPDPRDRRGVVLELTETGRARLDAYIDRGAHRERQLLEGLTDRDKRQLTGLLQKLLDSLAAERGPASDR